MKRPHKIPDASHPIAIARNPKRVIVKIGGRIVADSRNTLTVREASYPPVLYIPRNDIEIAHFTRTQTSTWCPYKGECAYFAANAGGKTVPDAAWSYEQPFEAAAGIREHFAFYPDRVDEISESD